MGYDGIRVFLITSHGLKKTPGKTNGLGEDENPVKLQKPCTGSYELYFKRRTRNFPLQTHRKQHDLAIKLTGLSMLYTGLHHAVLPYATVGLI